MPDRFRLVHFKSEGLVKRDLDEGDPYSEKNGGKLTTSSSSLEYPISNPSSSEIVFKQAEADLRHSDPRIRILAVKCYIEKANLSITMPVLQGILSDKDPEVRAQALDSLIKFKNPIISSLLKRHLKDKDPRVRVVALRGIFKLGERIDLNLLMQLLSDESPWVRRKIATLLGWNRIEGVLPILVEMSKDHDWKVRKAALASLVTLYPDEGEGRLVEATLDPSPEIQKWAKERLERILLKPIRRREVSH